ACGEGGCLREAGAAAAEQPLPILLDGRERAVELHHESSESCIRYQQVRAGADHSYLDPLGGGPGEQLGEDLVRSHPGEVVAVAARADGREPLERVVDRHVLRRRHAVSLFASSSTLPAPSEMNTSPSVSSARRLRSASSIAGIHHTGRPPAASAAASATR